MNKEKFLKMINYGRTYKVTDIHLSVEELPVFRMQNKLYKVDEFSILTKENLESLAEDLLSCEEKEILKEKREIEVSLEDEVASSRISIFYEKNNLAYAIRIIQNLSSDFEELNLSSKINDFFDDKEGLILVCGKSGSGKSSTIAAMIEKYNGMDCYNIITLEESIEFIHKNNKSLIRQREIGKDVEDYKSGIKSSLRQNADIIIIGELKNRETVEAAIKAAETGHLVIASMHAKGVVDSLERLVDLFDINQREYIQRLLAANLLGVIYQELIYGIDIKENTVPICEMLYTNSGVEGLIKQGKLNQISSFLDISGRRGVINKLESLKELYRSKKISQEQFDREIKKLRKI